MGSRTSPRLFPGLVALMTLQIVLLYPCQGRAATAASRLALATPGNEILWAAAQPAPPADSSGVRVMTPASSSLWLPTSEEGRFWRADRLQHAGASATVVIGAGALGAGDLEAAVLAASLGILKEVGDAAADGGISRLDLLADAVGIGLGLVLLRMAR